MDRRYLPLSALVAALACSSCGVEKSSNPLSPTVAGPIPGVNITAPNVVQPGNLAKVPTTEQPLTLTVSNASTTGVRPLTYLFEVAADTAFNTIVVTKSDVPPGTAQTSVRLDPLTADRAYYWRARAQDGANTGPYSAPVQFQIITQTIFEPPVPVSPVGGVVVSSLRPRFTWNNAARSASSSPVSYRIEVSEFNTFPSNLTASATTAEQAGQTSIDTPQDLPSNKQGFWHVQAFDAGSTGPWSATQVFRTPGDPVPSGGSGGGGGNQGGVAGCRNGRLEDPKAYVFSLIGRAEGSPAGDWAGVMNATGLLIGPGPGQKTDPRNHYGITQQIGAGGPRGVVFLPTDVPADGVWYTHEFQVVVADGSGGLVWGWFDRGGPAYAPRACP